MTSWAARAAAAALSGSVTVTSTSMWGDARQCGTAAAARAHWRRGEDICDPCRQARREYDRARTGAKARTKAPCGTTGGAAQHRKAKEPLCGPCKQAQLEYNRASRDQSPVDRQPCGTPAAAQRHYRAGEPLCQPCQEAGRRAARERKRAQLRRDRERRDSAEAA